MTEWDLFLYGAGKVLAYSAVCYACVTWVHRRSRAWLLAGLLGVLRAAMGLLFGVGIFLLSSALIGSATSLGAQGFAYLTIYVPVRWIEWGLIALIAVPATRSVEGFLLGSSARERCWRLLGVLVSCAADVPVWLVVGGLPVGRFMC